MAFPNGLYALCSLAASWASLRRCLPREQGIDHEAQGV